MSNHSPAFTLRGIVHVSIVLILLIALSGCGNGAGGDSPPPTNTPVATNGCSYLDSGAPLTATLSGTDPSGRSLTFELLDSAANGTVTLTNPLTGEFTYTPNANTRGTDSFTFRVNNGQTVSAPASYRLVHTPRILPVGDSITLGLTVNDEPPPQARVSYRRKLLQELSASSFRVDFVGSQQNGTAAGITDPDHEGHAGWCDDNNPACTISGGQNVADSITGFLDATSPDIVLLHIGTNHFNVSAVGVNSILDRISGWASSHHPVRVFVARIIPSVSGALDVTTFNNNVQGIANDRPSTRVFMVNQQAELQTATDPNRADANLMADELHPNTAGYEKMALRWRDAVLASGGLAQCP